MIRAAHSRCSHNKRTDSLTAHVSVLDPLNRSPWLRVRALRLRAVPMHAWR
jgi:hypothetical protein